MPAVRQCVCTDGISTQVYGESMMMTLYIDIEKKKNLIYPIVTLRPALANEPISSQNTLHLLLFNFSTAVARFKEGV